MVWCKIDGSVSTIARTTSTSPLCRALKKNPVSWRCVQLRPWPIASPLPRQPEINNRLVDWTWRGAQEEAHSPGASMEAVERRWRWVKGGWVISWIELKWPRDLNLPAKGAGNFVVWVIIIWEYYFLFSFPFEELASLSDILSNLYYFTLSPHPHAFYDFAVSFTHHSHSFIQILLFYFNFIFIPKLYI